MSRAYNARRKAKRQAQAAERGRREKRRPSLSRRTTLVPALLIAAIFAVVGVLGFGASDGASKEQVAQEVAELLDGVPQKGAALGSPEAPITVWVYGDVQCPTVRLFVENYLPSLIDGWVRAGAVKVIYRSLETDTSDEKVFFEQEVAALAAGRQDRMWNFLLTFVRQQGEPRTDYATEEFIAGVASQIPNLKLSQWHRDRKDALLSKQVALGVYSGHTHDLWETPSFLVSYAHGEGDRPDSAVEWEAMKKDVVSSLRRNLKALREEAQEDFPTLRVLKGALEGAESTEK